jgi:hypothetical protein
MEDLLKILKEVISVESKFFRAARNCDHVNPYRNMTDKSNGEMYYGCHYPKTNEIATCRPDRCPLRGEVF